MQTNPRILANLLANLPRMNPYRCIGGGAMGGLTPLTSLSQAWFPGLWGKPRRATHWVSGAVACSSCPKGQTPRATLRGCFPSNPPQMAPLILGLLGFAGSIPSRYSTDFHRFFQTFLGDLVGIDSHT